MMRRPRICQGSQVYELTDLGFVFGKPEKGEKIKKIFSEPDCFNWEQRSEEEAKTKGKGLKIPV